MIELYLNFGIFGVSIGMCLLGFMYRAFAGFPGSDSFDRLGFIYTAYLFSIVCDIEGAMSMVLGKVLYYGSFILVLVHLNIIIGRKLSKKVR